MTSSDKTPEILLFSLTGVRCNASLGLAPGAENGFLAPWIQNALQITLLISCGVVSILSTDIRYLGASTLSRDTVRDVCHESAAAVLPVRSLSCDLVHAEYHSIDLLIQFVLAPWSSEVELQPVRMDGSASAQSLQPLRQLYAFRPCNHLCKHYMLC